VVLLATTLLLVLGSALTLIAQSESSISATVLRDAQALCGAEAALRHAAVDLEVVSDWTSVLSGMATSGLTDGAEDGLRTVGRVTLDLGSLAAQLNTDAGRLPLGANNPHWTLFLWGPGGRLLGGTTSSLYLLVWVADDAAETDDDPLRDGGSMDRRGAAIVRLRAEAFDGIGARRVVEATAIRLVNGRVGLLMGEAVR
jgi:hypothetical protein